MFCSFCEGELDGSFSAVIALCPECERRLTAVAPTRPEYPWFVGAMRRAMFGEAAHPMERVGAGDAPDGPADFLETVQSPERF